MSQININGKSYSGNNINIKDNKITIDGNVINEDSKNITIEIHGNVEYLCIDACNSIVVSGTAGAIKTKSGNISIKSDVLGSIKTMSGNVHCDNVHGSILTMSGNIIKK